MVDILVRIGNCSCAKDHDFYFNDFYKENWGWFCFRDNAIYLGKYLEKECKCEPILNHEYLHVVIYELEGKEVTKQFDLLFDENNVIIGDDGTPTPYLSIG